MNILISTSSFGKEDAAPLELLRSEGFDITLNPYGRQLTITEAAGLLKNMDGIIAGTEKLNGESLSDAGRLKYIVRLGTGMDNVDFPFAEQRGIRVENTPDAHVDGVAELALGGILDCLRRISWSDRQIRTGTWVKPMGSLLKGKAVGLLGLGRVAKRLITLLQPFDCKVLAFDPHFDHAYGEKNGILTASKEEVCRQADIISLHLPFSEINRHIIDSAAFALMKDQVVIANTSRGGLVDEAALQEFLQAKPAATAYLDTFDQEPYNGPLARLENV
ncbi:MAG: hydroxyacid dehydrogenase, partial [Sphingobacteriales bacterium]